MLPCLFTRALGPDISVPYAETSRILYLQTLFIPVYCLPVSCDGANPLTISPFPSGSRTDRFFIRSSRHVFRGINTVPVSRSVLPWVFPIF